MCMDRYLSCHGFSTCCGVTKLGKLYFDNKVHHMKGIEHLYKVAVDKYKLEKENQALQEQKSILKIQEVQELIEDQCKKFPTASNFDYRILVNSDGSMDEDKLQGYFNPELLKLIDTLSPKDQKTKPIIH